MSAQTAEYPGQTNEGATPFRRSLNQIDAPTFLLREQNPPLRIAPLLKSLTAPDTAIYNECLQMT
jgi:hypothetical protein